MHVGALGPTPAGMNEFATTKNVAESEDAAPLPEPAALPAEAPGPAGPGGGTAGPNEANEANETSGTAETDDVPPSPFTREANGSGGADQRADAPRFQALQSEVSNDEIVATELRGRAEWLEDEARAIADPLARARALLAVSELYALCNDREQAHSFAVEAREIAPSLALAWHQARKLSSDAPEVVASSLDAEAEYAPTGAARLHARLLAADILRVHGHQESAIEHWKAAFEAEPADVRAPAIRSALALAQNNATGAVTATAVFFENSELTTLDSLRRAVTTALTLRGATQPSQAIPINAALGRMRLALAAGDAVAAAQSASEIAAEPSLAKAALWLSSALGTMHTGGRRKAASALKTLLREGESLARRQLAARGIELGDPELVEIAIEGSDTISLAERAALLALSGQDPGPVLSRDASMLPSPLVDAIAAVSRSATDAAARALHTSGQPKSRALATLGRLLAAKAESGAMNNVIGTLTAPLDPAARGVALELAVRSKRADIVYEAISELLTDEPQAAQLAPLLATKWRHLVCALLAERAARPFDAVHAYTEAIEHGATHDSVARALAKLDPKLDFARLLVRIADAMPDGAQGIQGEVLRLEAIARGTLDDAQTTMLFERVHAGAEDLGIAAVLAEQAARRRNDFDDVVRWMHAHRTSSTDAFEIAVDTVREALLVANRDREHASTLLEQAHGARPDDMALRELYERLATEPLTCRGQWRERRAEKSTGPSRALFFAEAALEYQAASDTAGALRAATSAREAGDKGLCSLIAERAAIATGAAHELTSELAMLATTTENPTTRRETFERLADIEAYGRKDMAAAVRWHRAALEVAPRSKISLRFVEHALITRGSDDELDPIFEQIASALDGTGGGESTGHAQLAARLYIRRRAAQGTRASWEETAPLARLASKQSEPSLWAIRALNGHARVEKDDSAILSTMIELVERTQRPAERAALLLRAAEAASRLDRHKEARAYLEQAASEDPGDVVTWGLLTETRAIAGEKSASAEACESLARTSSVPNHQLLAWYQAARIWLEDVGDAERGMSALEQCAEIDANYEDIFDRLSKLYSERRLDAELAHLLERRLETVHDDGERVAIEVELARAVLDMGELQKAKASLESALERQPDHSAALSAMAELCAKEGDWAGAEQAYIRLARAVPSEDEQRAIYQRLGEIYAQHTVNLSRAEVAYREVLKRKPKDVPTLEKLIDIYRRQGDAVHAVEIQQELAAEATDPDKRIARLMELAKIHEVIGHDMRRTEQVLEAARREFPASVVVLRAMAEFYVRQHQMPAMHILLDRAAADARRTFATGRFVTSIFEVLHATCELRGNADGARIVSATLAAVEGRSAKPGSADPSSPPPIAGADARAVDPRLDEILAPEIISPALRTLLFGAGDALDAVSAVDLRALRATPLAPRTPLGTTIGTIAKVIGLGALQVVVSPQLKRLAIPLSSNPPTLLVGERLTAAPEHPATTFVIVRALKMIHSRASALVRSHAQDVALLISALFTTFNPAFVPQGVDARRAAELARHIAPALPRNLDRNVRLVALEAAGTLGAQAAMLGPGAVAWANRVALLAVGDPAAALDGIAWAHGEDSAPQGQAAAAARATWIARTTEARELIAFGVTDMYAEARARLGLSGRAP